MSEFHIVSLEMKQIKDTRWKIWAENPTRKHNITQMRIFTQTKNCLFTRSSFAKKWNGLNEGKENGIIAKSTFYLTLIMSRHFLRYWKKKGKESVEKKKKRRKKPNTYSSHVKRYKELILFVKIFWLGQTLRDKDEILT